MSDKNVNAFIPYWVQDVDRIRRELKRMNVMLEKLRRNTADDELREAARELETKTESLGERYVSLGNEDALI